MSNVIWVDNERGIFQYKGELRQLNNEPPDVILDRINNSIYPAGLNADERIGILEESLKASANTCITDVIDCTDIKFKRNLCKWLWNDFITEGSEISSLDDAVDFIKQIFPIGTLQDDMVNKIKMTFEYKMERA